MFILVSYSRTFSFLSFSIAIFYELTYPALTTISNTTTLFSFIRVRQVAT